MSGYDITPMLSVIIPIYNSEKYLSECISSVLGQTFNDFELILINDGSTDNSLMLCQEFARKDERIIVIDQVNKGVSAARNAGLDNAKGKYLCFVDSDDIVYHQMFEAMVKTAEDNSADMAVIDLSREYKPEHIKLDNLSFEKLEKDELLMDLFARPSKCKGYACNRMIRSSCIGEIRYNPEIKMWEDIHLLMRVYSENKDMTAVYLPYSFYYYRENPESASANKNSYRLISNIYGDYFYTYLKENAPECLTASLLFYLDSMIGLISKNRKINKLYNRINILNTKRNIVKWVVIGRMNGLLSKTAVHRFLVEGLIRS